MSDTQLQMETHTFKNFKVGDLIHWNKSSSLIGIIIKCNEDLGIKDSVYMIKWADRPQAEPFSYSAICSMIEQGRMKHYPKCKEEEHKGLNRNRHY